MTSLLIACLLATGLTSCTETPSDPGPLVPREAGTSPRYDAVWGVATHNSYWVDRGTMGDAFASGVGERLLDQLLFDHARGLEIDIHESETAHAFRVYHTVPGNSLCDGLDECLAVLRAFHRTLPEHEPVTVVLELKELFGPNFDEEHTIEDLDRALRDGLGPLLYQPADFMAPCDDHGVTTLAECARTAEWPGVKDLRGKFLFAVLGNWDAVSAQGTADWAAYATHGDIHDRAAFPMASAWKLEQTTLPPWVQDLVTQDDLDAAMEQSLLLQIEAIDDPLAAGFLEGHGVIRVDNAFSVDDQEKAVSEGMQLLQSDAPWIQYDDRGPGQPLRALSPDVPDEMREPGSRLALLTSETTGVLAALAAEQGTTLWETTGSLGRGIAGQACLCAADDFGAASWASVTLCIEKQGEPGTPDVERLTVRLTTCEDGVCEESALPSEDATAGGPGELLSLSVDISGGETCVQARSARLADTDLEPRWTSIGEERCFAAELFEQGLWRPSGATPAWFFGTTRNDAPVRSADLDHVEVHPTDGQPPTQAPDKLVDASWP